MGRRRPGDLKPYGDIEKALWALYRSFSAGRPEYSGSPAEPPAIAYVRAEAALRAAGLDGEIFCDGGREITALRFLEEIAANFYGVAEPSDAGGGKAILFSDLVPPSKWTYPDTIPWPGRLDKALNLIVDVIGRIGAGTAARNVACERRPEGDGRAGRGGRAETPAAEPEREAGAGWMDYRQAAAHIGVSVGALRNMVYRRKIPFSRRGGIVRFQRERLDEWLGGKRRSGGPERSGGEIP
ncbi:MAG: helix-turn-helix domain-containing protein [Planctomycetota bacterium]|nr:helix-turn-helix domain-containing protein [Planctomycetota bacterium]